MNESKIIYRKEYVQNAIELLKQADLELVETAERINENINGILTANEFIYVDQKDKNLKEPKVSIILKDIEEETKDNIEFLETASMSMENYAKDIEGPANYQNPITGSDSNPTIKHGPAIAALAGLATVGASAFLSNQEDEEKTEIL